MRNPKKVLVIVVKGGPKGPMTLALKLAFRKIAKSKL
jgi:hypothetical protein